MKALTLRAAPALVLFFAAPLVAEWLLGDLSLRMIGALVLLAPIYGGGAILVREVARRRGGGWPAILALAAAYGVIEEGLLTQSLFNPHYLGLHLLAYGYVPVLGTSPVWTTFVLTIHVVWSMCIPIALTETAFRSRGTRPWLGVPGLVVAGVLYVIGAAGTIAFSYLQAHFLARPGQLVAAALVALALVAVGLWQPWRGVAEAAAAAASPAPVAGRPWLPWALAAAALVVCSAFFMLAVLTPSPLPLPAPVTAVLLVAIDLGALAGVYRASSRPGWTAVHRFALAAGALLTYCWVGLAQMSHRSPIDLALQAVLVLVAVGLLALLARRLSGPAAEAPPTTALVQDRV
jgi:hypothetical protein